LVDVSPRYRSSFFFALKLGPAHARPTGAQSRLVLASLADAYAPPAPRRKRMEELGPLVMRLRPYGLTGEMYIAQWACNRIAVG